MSHSYEQRKATSIFQRIGCGNQSITPVLTIAIQRESIVANNDIMRSIRDALNIDDTSMIRIFKESGREVGQSTISAFLKSEDEDGYIPCNDPVFGFFLEGLIIHKRGRKDDKPSAPPLPVVRLAKNDIVKKLRIALDLKEEDLVSIFKAGGITVSKNDLSALFRKECNKHYKECSDVIFKGFLKGLASFKALQLNKNQSES
jgi:uncharacterized protein YehS (DUF1456 family)